MKFKNKRHEKAIALKREIDKANKAHEKHIDEWGNKKFSSKAAKTRSETAFLRREKKYDEHDNKTYKAYYDHMHEDFSNEDIQKNLVKYKEGFVDEKFINDMYRNKSHKGESNVKNSTSRKK